MTSRQVEDARTHAFRCAPISFSGTEPTAVVAGSAEPDRALDRAQREKKLQRALERLPNRLRSVVDMSCAEDMTLSQIGVRLGVSEARACQLRQQAVDQLRISCADSFRPAARNWIASAA